jgi:hypothetical protein
MIDDRRTRRIGALDADFACRLLMRQIGPEARGMLLLIDRKRVGLPFRFALRIGRTAHVCGEEAASCHSEAVRSEHHWKARMVGKVFPHWKVGDNFNPERPQPFSRANSGALQDCGAVVDPSANHDLVRRRGPPL